jgi:AraC-like DNA-binding protein
MIVSLPLPFPHKSNTRILFRLLRPPWLFRKHHVNDCAEFVEVNHLCAVEIAYQRGKFALRVRLAAAARDIGANLLTLAEIAQKRGFCDDSSFSNAFRKVYRYPPRPLPPSRGFIINWIFMKPSNKL